MFACATHYPVGNNNPQTFWGNDGETPYEAWFAKRHWQYIANRIGIPLAGKAEGEVLREISAKAKELQEALLNKKNVWLRKHGELGNKGPAISGFSAPVYEVVDALTQLEVCMRDAYNDGVGVSWEYKEV